MPAIDEAIRRIVDSQKPYRVFPPGLAREWDHLGGETVGGGHLATGDSPRRRHARDTRGAVDEHRAAAALALRAAPVLRRPDAEPVAQHLEQRAAVVGDLDGPAVHPKLQAHSSRIGSAPMDTRLTRRSFLAAGVGLTVGAACGGSGKKRASSTTAPPDQLEVIQASAQLIAGADQPVSLAFGRSLTRLAPARPAEPHADGIPTKPYYLTRQHFDVAGQWWVVASTGGKQGATQLDVINAADTQVPLPGQRMVPVATPTVADHRGVEPICTRQPVCPLHEASLDAALNEHRPLAVLFATPALCESRTCGPDLDVLLTQVPAFQDKVRFVHVEVYRSLQASEANLTDGMRAYHLDFEPVLYLAAPDGTIKDRLDGPFDIQEAKASLTRLVS